MSEFTYLIRGGDGSSMSREEGQQHMQKWITWMKELGEKGQLKDHGNPLERSGKVVKGNQKTVTDGPYAETKDIVGGYMLVEAKDISEAVEISKGCPVFDTGGMVEIRPVMKM